MPIYNGQCYCGAVKFEVDGDKNQPVLPPHICHCHDCRHMSASEAGHSIIYKDQAFRVTAGDDKLKKYSSNDGVQRPFCTECGTRVYKHIDATKFTIVYPSTFDVCNGTDGKSGGQLPAEWKVQRHIFYGSRYTGHEYDDHTKFYATKPADMGNKEEQLLSFQGSKL